MKVTIVGTGYVGLVSGTCFADLGNDVICLDVNEKKIADLNEGKIPIYEPGLSELVLRNAAEGRLTFTTNAQFAIESSDVIFIAVGTPMGENHEADLCYVRAVAKSISKYANGYKVVVNKSTVPVGTAALVSSLINRGDVDVVSNPEFLKEGAAIKDFMNPDRIVVGCDSKKAEGIMRSLYAPLTRAQKPLIVTDIKSAELIKYASNAMLATRISFMNELSHFAEKVGADITKVSLGMGLDSRIGSRFLHAGLGYGGSCFPKDVQALIASLEKESCSAHILRAVEDANLRQKQSVLPKVKQLLGENLKGKRIALFGIAFKPKTDDVREAPSLEIIKSVLDCGGEVVAFDPVAEENCKQFFPDIIYAKTPYDALVDVDCLVIATEWDEFRSLDKLKMKALMRLPNIVDGRNIYDKEDMVDFSYLGIGR